MIFYHHVRQGDFIHTWIVTTRTDCGYVAQSCINGHRVADDVMDLMARNEQKILNEKANPHKHQTPEVEA